MSIEYGMGCFLRLSDGHTIIEKIKEKNGNWKIINIKTYPYFGDCEVILMKYTNELSYLLTIHSSGQIDIRMMDNDYGNEDENNRDNFFDIDCSTVNITINYNDDDGESIVFDQENCCYHSSIFINKYGFDISVLSESHVLQKQFINNVINEFSNLDHSIIEQCDPIHIKMLQRFLSIENHLRLAIKF
jgi:hypothetical protein